MTNPAPSAANTKTKITTWQRLRHKLRRPVFGPRDYLVLLWLLLAVVVLWLTWLRWPQRLDIDLPPQSRTGTAVAAGRAGDHTVYLNLVPHGDDNGPATIRVSVDGRFLTEIDTFYDYDLWLDRPAGHTYRWWVDGDWRPDVIITTGHEPPRRYVISSASGQIYE